MPRASTLEKAEGDVSRRSVWERRSIVIIRIGVRITDKIREIFILILDVGVSRSIGIVSSGGSRSRWFE